MAKLNQFLGSAIEKQARDGIASVLNFVVVSRQYGQRHCLKILDEIDGKKLLPSRLAVMTA